MSFCYFCVSITYLIGGSMAKHVSCGVLSSTQTPLVTQVGLFLKRHYVIIDSFREWTTFFVQPLPLSTFILVQPVLYGG
jgi:hypothetical protein